MLLLGPRGVRRVRRRRLRRRLLGSHRRRHRARRRAPRAHRALDRSGVGGQPRLADLHLRRDLDRVPRGVRVDQADDVRPADHRRARHRPAWRELRVPQVGGRRCATGGSSAPRSRSPRCWCRTAWARSPAGSPPAGCPPAARPATRWTAGSTRRRSSAACWPSRWPPTWPRSTWSGTPAAPATTGWSSTSAAAPSLAAVVAACSAPSAWSSLHADAAYVFDGLTVARPAASCSLGVVCGIGALVLLVRDAARGARVLAVARGGRRHRLLGRGAVALPPARDASPSSRRPRPSGTLAALVVAVVLPRCIVLPGFVLLYVLVQRQLLPDEGVDGRRRPAGRSAAG